MFRNVTGAQEAVVHRQSEDSLSYEQNQIKLIKDVQSDDIAQTYAILKNKWIDQREQLIGNLRTLEKQNAYPQEIQRVRNLIECLNELIESGEVSKNCDTLINDTNPNIQPSPETYILARKSLGDKSIRLPRRTSKTTTNICNPLKTIPSDMLRVQQTNDKLGQQTNHRIHNDRKQLDDPTDLDSTTTASLSTEKMTTGIQFYVIAEHFRDQTDTKKTSEKKHYFSSAIIE